MDVCEYQWNPWSHTQNKVIPMVPAQKSYISESTGRCDAMRLFFTRGDAMRFREANHTGRCDAMNLFKRHWAMLCDAMGPFLEI